MSLIGMELTAPRSRPLSPLPQTSMNTLGSNFNISGAGDYIRCARCRHPGCDLQVSACGCSFHARCMPLDSKASLKTCPACQRPCNGLVLFPMNFNEIDEANKAADSLTKLSGKRGRKRKNSLISSDETKEEGKPNNSALNRKNNLDEKDKENGCRTGRWTNEEMAYCDKLIYLFKEGQLPLAAGVKLNDFLASMVKSKQSRLTKKMKNAKLSSNTYNPSSGHILNLDVCATFSSLEENFFHAIVDPKERAELKFHMRKEWREMFSSYCLSIGQALDADAWLNSVEEMDRRVARAKGASRLARRKLMMGYALCQDFKCAEAGVFIERTSAEIAAAENNEPLKPFSSDAQFHPSETDEFLALLNDEAPFDKSVNFAAPSATAGASPSSETEYEIIGKSSILHNSPFLNKVMGYIKRHNVPFEHVDVWVPNLNGNDGPEADTSKCRLGFAGSATAETVIPSVGKPPAQQIDSETKFNLLAFGDYSQKFSFAVNCGLPGRVFHSGLPIWEEDVHLASNTHFERSGGAVQWGLKTVVGIPLPSPNVGRIVVVLYSSHSRQEDQNLVMKLQDEFAKLLPTPKWKLVVDMSFPTPCSSSVSGITSGSAMSTSRVDEPSSHSCNAEDGRNGSIHEIVTLLGEEMPSDCSSTAPPHVQALTSLRLLLLRSSRSPKEDEIVRTIIGSYSSYSGSGRHRSEIALMLTRDFTFLMETPQSHPPIMSHQQMEQNKQATVISNHSNHSLPPIRHHQHNFQDGVGQQAIHGHHGPMQSTPTPFQAPSPPFSDDVLSSNANKNNSQPTVMEMSMSFFPIPQGTDFNLDQSFRADSPVLTAIEPMGLPGPVNPVGGDNFSIVSN